MFREDRCQCRGIFGNFHIKIRVRLHWTINCVFVYTFYVWLTMRFSLKALRVYSETLHLIKTHNLVGRLTRDLLLYVSLKFRDRLRQWGEAAIAWDTFLLFECVVHEQSTCAVVHEKNSWYILFFFHNQLHHRSVIFARFVMRWKHLRRQLT